MTKKNTPDTFDFAEWFGDENVPEESRDVFTGAHLVGEINALQRQIEEDDRGAPLERSIGDEMSEDEERLAGLLQEFADSKRTLYMRGLTPGQLRSIRKAHEASHQDDEDFVHRCIAASVVAIRTPKGKRTPVSLSLSGVQKLERQIGSGQIALLFKTYQQVTAGVPTVDADFLLRRSGPESTQES